ncbi:MAG TPA: UDP-glucose/GDP-mannose dehydrogenase family protein [Bacteroidales bacterium]|nr:UDP-glucose/GDP-mannose dehydrogenase family protein [Bacteroidales bacterium]HRZ48674.1 UDP-glucose/GDP-mannose dehydrogenase family protein [Bacteroidales bacterium]
MKIAVVGTGYVGLVTGACFAEVGIEVICVDIDKEKIDKLKHGIIPIYEPGLDKIVKSNFEKGRLSFSTDLVPNLPGCEVVFSAVGTPPDEDGSADLSYVLEVARQVGRNMEDYLLIVTKSTVPVGTAAKVKEAIKKELAQRGVDIPFDIASNPEFLKEGDAVNDFLKPDRIVVGTESARAREIMERLYKPFTENGHPVIFMDVPSAEMTKYAANAMLATRISFMNDLANLCERLGADINLVREGIGSDRRIGKKFINAGIGYGGSCFPKDVKALIRTAAENQYELKILRAVEEVNDRQKSVMFDKIKQYFDGNLVGRTVAMWGLAFKPETDDMREAPSLVMIEKLHEAGCRIQAYDPVAYEEAGRKFGNIIRIHHDPYEALEGADCLLIVTEWKEFSIPKFDVIMEKLSTPAIFDGRNMYDKDELKALGFDYFCIGVNTSK